MQELLNALLQDYDPEREIDLTAQLCPPEAEAVQALIGTLQRLLFPDYFQRDSGCGSRESCMAMLLWRGFYQLEELVLPLLQPKADPKEAEKRIGELCRTFLRQLPRLRDALREDLMAFLAGDPAAAGEEEILACYPGFYAITVYRLAHVLYELQVPVLPRMMAELAHSKTGIDIHPGARIGGAFFIDHGTGVVIGQTAVIGNHVKLYQGVTVGALSTRGGQSLRNRKRHPTIEDDVTVYAGASILGGDTVIGRGATIGSNAFITASVPAMTRVRGPGL